MLPERASQDVPPRAVPGYAEAAAAGRIPRVPAEPPALGPRPSAQRMFRTFMLGCVAAFPLYFVIQQVLRMLHVPGLATMAVLVALTMGLFWAMFARLARIGERSIEEFRLGYTTLVLGWGGFWAGEGRFRLDTEMRTPWDYSALWHLVGSTGAVIRPPQSHGDPPGMYPSPTRLGSLELWTGVMWLRHFADDPSRSVW